MALYLRCGRRLPSNFLASICPGSSSRFCSSNSQDALGGLCGGRGRLPVETLMEQVAPGAEQLNEDPIASIPHGFGRGKQSGMADRLGMSAELLAMKSESAEAFDYHDRGSNELPIESSNSSSQSPDQGRFITSGTEEPGTGFGQNPARGEFVGPDNRRSTVWNGLGRIPKGIEREYPSLSRPRGGAHPRTGLGPRHKAQTLVIAGIGKGSRSILSPRPRRNNTSKPPGGAPELPSSGSTADSGPGPKNEAQSGTKIAKPAPVSEDNWLKELSPRKKHPVVEVSKPVVSTNDWLDELSPRSKRASLRGDSVTQPEVAPSSPVAEHVAGSSQDAVSSSVEDAHMKPTSEVTHPSTPSEVSPQHVVAHLSDDGTKQDVHPPITTAEGQGPSETKEEGEKDEFTLKAHAAPPPAQGERIEEPAEEVETPEQLLIFKKFLQKTQDADDFTADEVAHPSEVRGDPQEMDTAEQQSEHRQALEGYDATKELSPPRSPVDELLPSSQPSPTPPTFQGGSLMDRLGWNQPGPSATSEVRENLSPGIKQPSIIRSKLAERLGWSGDGDEAELEERSRGRRKAPRRRPLAGEEEYPQRSRVARLTPDARRSTAFRSAKAMEMALEGRLDEFDPDSVEIPEESPVEHEQQRYPQREQKEGSAVGLDIRENEIPVPEWKGAPHNLDEYYVRDAFTDMGQHPSQNKVMDMERMSSLELDPNYMVNFGPPVPWAQMDYNQTPRRYLMKHKDDIMDMIRLTGGDPSEEDFLQAAQIGLHDFKDWKKWMDSGKMHKGESLHGNVKLEEAFMHHIVDSTISDQHPMYAHLKQTVHSLEHNPHWSFAKKARYLQKIVKNAEK